MKTITVSSPIKIGDKVWLRKGFGSSEFLKKYKNYHEYVVKKVKVEVEIKENSELEYTFLYQVEGGTETNTWYLYNEKTPRTKEQLYESFREEIEELIPEDLRKYLWQL